MQGVSNGEFGNPGNAESNLHYQLQEEQMWWLGSKINRRMGRRQGQQWSEKTILKY